MRVDEFEDAAVTAVGSHPKRGGIDIYRSVMENVIMEGCAEAVDPQGSSKAEQGPKSGVSESRMRRDCFTKHALKHLQYIRLV